MKYKWIVAFAVIVVVILLVGAYYRVFWSEF